MARKILPSTRRYSRVVRAEILAGKVRESPEAIRQDLRDYLATVEEKLEQRRRWAEQVSPNRKFN